MDRIVVEGGVKLNGEIEISGAKNAALPILISSLLADGESVYSNVPRLMDIESIKLLLSSLGARIESDDRTVRIDGSGLYNHEAPYELVRKMRASILVLGPLMARLKKARVSLPGGCAIGARPINFHLKGLERLGAAISLNQGYVEASAVRLKGTEIFFDIVTVTGTENMMMAAVLADGITTLHNAAQEPEVVAHAEVLKKMGASLNPVSVSIIPDRIETGTYMIAAALTNGEITLKNCEPNHLEAVINKLEETGTRIETGEGQIRVTGPSEIKSADLKTLPYPGFPTDLQAQFMVLMSVANGQSIISETIFENRFIHVSELERMGADITISGNSAMIKGVSNLSGAPVMATDLRASASLILAGLVAQGTTEINRVYHLDRGYEAIEKKFESLGARINRISV